MAWLPQFMRAWISKLSPKKRSRPTLRHSLLPRSPHDSVLFQVPGTLTPLSHQRSVEQAIREACSLYPHLVESLHKIASKACAGGRAFFFNSNIDKDNAYFQEWQGKSGLRITRNEVNIFGTFTVDGEKNNPETLELLSHNLSKAAQTLHGHERWISSN